MAVESDTIGFTLQNLIKITYILQQKGMIL